MRSGVLNSKVKGVVNGYGAAQELQGNKDVIVHDIIKNEFIVIGFAPKNWGGGNE